MNAKNVKDIIEYNVKNNIFNFTIDNVDYSDIIKAISGLDYDIVLNREEEIIKVSSNWGRGFKVKHRSSTEIDITRSF